MNTPADAIHPATGMNSNTAPKMPSATGCGNIKAATKGAEVPRTHKTW
jgi:hypothetical protein